MHTRYYNFKNFIFQFNPASGQVVTQYPDATSCLIEVNPDHEFHGQLLGISGKQANLLHELAHHLVARALGHKTCPIVWDSAHLQPLPGDAHLLEWQITAMSYFAMEKPMREVSEWGAIMDLAKVCDVFALRKKLLTLFYLLSHD